MKTVIAAALLLVVAGAATAQARVDFNVHIDVPVAVAPVPPPVAVATYPAGYPVGYQGGYQGGYPAPSQIVYEEPPRFIFSPNLGFYVSVGTQYDIAYVDNGYYLYRGGNWYLAPYYGGPWSVVSYRRLPHGLHKHSYQQIRHYRDHEYRSYSRDRGHYRGNWHHPKVERVNYRKDGHRYDHRDNRDNRRDYWELRRDHRDDRRDHRDGHRGGGR